MLGIGQSHVTSGAIGKDDNVPLVRIQFRDCIAHVDEIQRVRTKTHGGTGLPPNGTTWSGDAHFAMVEAAIRKALESKQPSRDHVDDEPERPRRRRAGQVRQVHNASGIPDVFVDGGRAARLLRDSESNVERPSGRAGYQNAGESIGEDAEDDA